MHVFYEAQWVSFVIYHHQFKSACLEHIVLLIKKIGYENYLSQIQNTKLRISLTKFSLSNHGLLIETGRHQHIEKHLRFCPRSIEDEFHSLLVYKILRNDLFSESRKQGRYIFAAGKP